MAFIQSSESKISHCDTLLAESRKVTINLQQIHTHLICLLCNGYIRDAETIKECIHTFCRSCIRAYFVLWKRRKCPTCDTQLGTKPLKNLMPDPTMQELVRKILPEYIDNEMEKQKFYEINGFPRKAIQSDKTHTPNYTKKTSTGKSSYKSTVKSTEKIRFELYPQQSHDLPLFMTLDKLKIPYMHTSPQLKVQHLRKYVAKKLGLQNPEEVDILCSGKSVGSEYSLAFILRTQWENKETKLILHYRRKPM